MEFKKLSAVDSVVKPIDTARVLIEEDGVIKKTPKSAIGAQADWAEIDETSPAFVKNKPVEEYDLDMIVTLEYIDEDGSQTWDYNVINAATVDKLKEKIENGEALDLKVAFDLTSFESAVSVHFPPCRLSTMSSVGAAYAKSYGEVSFMTASDPTGFVGLRVYVYGEDQYYFEAWVNF